MKSEDAFRPPPALVSIQAGLLDGEAPLDLSAGVSVGVVEDHMKVRSPPPPPFRKKNKKPQTSERYASVSYDIGS